MLLYYFEATPLLYTTACLAIVFNKTCLEGERFFIDDLLRPNPLVHRDDFSRPALRHGNLNPLFQVAVYLPS